VRLGVAGRVRALSYCSTQGGDVALGRRRISEREFEDWLVANPEAIEEGMEIVGRLSWMIEKQCRQEVEEEDYDANPHLVWYS
jgi:hypothetical protein